METLKELFDRLEKENKEICDLHRVIGKDPTTGEDIEMIVIKTCPKKEGVSGSRIFAGQGED